MKIAAIILTFNEERHLERAINSIAGIADGIFVVDCGSTDNTTEIARRLGATVLQNPWKNYSTQFNWAIDQIPANAEWVLRLDADEIVTEALAAEIKADLSLLGQDIDGVFMSRRMTFLGRPIVWGGVFPIRVLRLFRRTQGRCENRWMDEHIIVNGRTAEFQGEIIDDNLNSLTWWTEKHNSYSSREAIDLLNLEYRFMAHETVAALRTGQQAGVKRWIKEHLYSRLPGGLRAFFYFFYRYIVRLGFLDGREGTAFHVLQGLWYRFLVDSKIYEVKKHMRTHQVDAPTAIEKVLRIKID